MKKSMLEVSYDLVERSENPITFNDMLLEIENVLGLKREEVMERVGVFYTALSLDGRFVNLGDNTWDLRKRQAFSKVHIDINDVYSEDVEDEDEIEEDEEDIEELEDEKFVDEFTPEVVVNLDDVDLVNPKLSEE